ncbi:MAG: hypothetical protein ACI4IT_01785 [Oscillospiraceae bacterium]
MKKRFIIPIAFAVILLIVFYIWYFKDVYPKTFIFFDGDYYSTIGATVTEKSVGEKIGEVERNSPRTFWNRSGDSNNVPVGSGIYSRSDPEYEGEGKLLVGILYTDIDGTIKEEYWLLVKEE